MTTLTPDRARCVRACVSGGDGLAVYVPGGRAGLVSWCTKTTGDACVRTGCLMLMQAVSGGVETGTASG
jgi:hypothetical protein